MEVKRSYVHLYGKEILGEKFDYIHTYAIVIMYNVFISLSSLSIHHNIFPTYNIADPTHYQ